MGKEIRADYSQTYLLPPSLEDWIGVDHPARFIRDFVDSLNLGELGFELPVAEEGRPPYAVDLLLKVWLYGYLNKIRSSRSLERACREHMSLVWLTGNHGPDHNTLWRFWSGHEQALKQVFKQSVVVAYKSGMVGLVSQAVDGSKIAANVSPRGGWHQGELEKLLAEVERSLAAMTKAVESGERRESGSYSLPDELQDVRARRRMIEGALAELAEVERSHLHPVDKDARLMKDGNYDYNSQIVVDSKAGIIVAEAVVNEESDNHQLMPMVELAQENLGETASETLADAGYYSPEQLAEAEAVEVEVLVSIPRQRGRRWSKGEFISSNFTYNEERDVFICPLGKELVSQGTISRRRNKSRVYVYRCLHRDCPKRSECSHSRQGRSIERSEHHRAIKRQRLKQEQPEKKELLKRRKVIVEPVFAQIKEHQEFRRFTVRGLAKVRTQWSMICTAYNLKKLYRTWVSGILQFS
jgi:transposase